MYGSYTFTINNNFVHHLHLAVVILYANTRNKCQKKSDEKTTHRTVTALKDNVSNLTSLWQLFSFVFSHN